MRTTVDERLRREAAQFRLRFACDDCAHATRGLGLQCSLGYPPTPRRDALQHTELAFCKEFELG